MAVRSSIYKKQTTSHEHIFGAENFDAERDIYYRVCSTCSYQQEYEKMWFYTFYEHCHSFWKTLLLLNCPSLSSC